MLLKITRIIVVPLVLILTGCKHPIDCTADTGVKDRYQIGEWLVDVDAGNGSWEVQPQASENPVMSSSVCAGQSLQSPVSTANGEPLVLNFTGSFRNLPKAMDKLRWQSIKAEKPEINYDGTLSITWNMENSESVRIEFKGHDRGNLWVGIVNEENHFNAAEMRLDCPADEAFFGLGTQSTGLDLSGRRYPLWTQEQGVGKVDNDLTWPLTNRREAAYAPIGVWHSSQGYSAVIGHDSYSDIDLCSTDEGFKLRSYKLPPSFVLVKGNTLKQRLTEATEYVGRLKETPPNWVFAPWNDAAAGDAWLRETISQLRDNEIPSSVIWSEDWAGGEHTPLILKLSFNWDWDPVTYPNLPSTIDELHNKGFAFLTYFNPFVSKKGDNWSYGDDNGLFIQNSKGKTHTFIDYFFAKSTMLDLTNPNTLDWLKQSQLYAAQVTGIDGWMADFAEWLPVTSHLYSGEDPWIAHNQYPLQWQAANRAALADAHEDNNWTFFVRSGWGSINGGSPGIAPVLWAGDQNTNWTKGDGLPSVIPIGAHAGISGVPLFGSDIGGYISMPPLIPHTDKELFFRWVSLGAFSPIMRTHHGTTNCGNWMFNSDAQTIAHYKRYAEIHTLLLPFFQHLTQEAQQFGWPVLRHPVLADESHQDVWLANESLYFLGDDVLVAPVVTRRSEERKLLLPAGHWWPLFGHERMAMSQSEIAVPAATTEIPVFVKGGTILPLLAEVVDSFYGIEPEFGTDLDDIAGQFRLALYPGEEGQLRQTELEGARINGQHWPANSAQLDWSHAEWNAEPLPACEPNLTQNCYFDKGIKLIGVTQGLLIVGDAELTIEGNTVHDWIIQIAGDAWGELAKPTEYEFSKVRHDNCELIVGH